MRQDYWQSINNTDLVDYLTGQKHKFDLLLNNPKCNGETLKVQLEVTMQTIGMIEREILKRQRQSDLGR